MKVWYQGGIHLILDGKHLLLDPVSTPDLDVEAVFVSHGHSDHAKGLTDMKGYPVVLHPATLDYKRESMDTYSNEIHTIVEGESIDMLGITVEAYRSAHCVGGLQFKFIGRESTVVFTGDINLTGTYIEAEAPILKGDALIIESNFGHPKYVFPERKEILSKLGAWIAKYSNEKPIVLFGHGLGKTQEITQFICDIGVMRNGSKLLMSGLAWKSNMIFEKYRYRFSKRFHRFNNGTLISSGDFLIHPIYERVNIETIMKIRQSLQLQDAAFAHISGWTIHRAGNYNFPLSSHSGYDELVRYIKSSETEEVFTFHGYAETLARKMNEIGIQTTPLTKDNGVV